MRATTAGGHLAMDKPIDRPMDRPIDRMVIAAVLEATTMASLATTVDAAIVPIRVAPHRARLAPPTGVESGAATVLVAAETITPTAIGAASTPVGTVGAGMIGAGTIGNGMIGQDATIAAAPTPVPAVVRAHRARAVEPAVALTVTAAVGRPEASPGVAPRPRVAPVRPEERARARRG